MPDISKQEPETLANEITNGEEQALELDKPKTLAKETTDGEDEALEHGKPGKPNLTNPCRHKTINRRAKGTNQHYHWHQCKQCGKKWRVEIGGSCTYE